MNYVIRDCRDTSEYAGYISCPDNKNILTQFKYICKEEGILNYRDPWEAFQKTIALNYTHFITEYAQSEECDLCCKLCGHYGCKTLWEAESEEPITYDLTESCKIKLPKSVICGSECIGIPIKMRELLAELSHYSKGIRLREGRLDIPFLLENLYRPISLYVPEGLCYYDWPIELYCTTGEFKWTDWYALQVKKRKNGLAPKHWRVTTYTKPKITANFDYMVHIKG